MDDDDVVITNSDDFRAMLAGGEQIVANRTLRHEEWLRYDNELIAIARERLVIVNDLRMAGLVVNMGNIGITESRWELSGDMTEATVNMDGDTEGQRDRVTFGEASVPIPIIHKNFSLGMRQLAASRTRGPGLDVTQVGIATRIVVDTLEDMVFNGLPKLVVADKTIYGITTHPDRNTVTLGGSGWTVAASRNILNDTLAMIHAMNRDNMGGPFNMYVAKDIWPELQMDYSDEKGDRTHKERIEAFAEIAQVKRGDSLAPGTVVLIQLTRDVIDLAVSQDIVNIEWSLGDPMKTIYKIWCAMAVRVKSTKSGQSGICVGTV